MLLRSNMLTLVILMLCPVWSSQAEPLDLANDGARWISVEFEVSPIHLPGQVDTDYTLPYPAWVEPIDQGQNLRVTISAAVTEMLVRDRRPVPGSFSDFVWVFDRQTGDVLSARFTGRLQEEVKWGWFSTTAEAQIRVDMASDQIAGYRGAQNFLGNHVNRYCVEPSKRCTLVTGRGLDARGYANAVGSVTARSGVVSVETYSPLGEALFSELRPLVADVASPPPVIRASAQNEISEN